ncbi:MAG: sulfatase-like hydrolase/transferase [Pirellulaceae bacterium]
MSCRSVLVFIIGALWAASGTGQQPPNIVLIMADDVGWECFGCYGGEDYPTPNIDALAASGVRFAHCYSQPLCTPSRVQIMTGKYNFRNYTHFGYLDPSQRTFGQMMKSAGYRTAIAGKWQLNGLSHRAEGHDDRSRPIQAGFDEYCLWQLTIPRGGDQGSERFWSPALECNGKVLSKEMNFGRYGPDIMSDFVCDFIDRNREHPFFVYYPTVLVHDPFVPTPETIGNASRGHDANRSPRGKAQRRENFAAMVGYLDKIVGKIVAKLAQVEQLDNTIVIFTSDNGTNVAISSRWNGQSIQGGKGTTTDMGTHVPLIASWKGISPEGVVSTDLIDFSDVYPTLAEAAGIPMPASDTIDGRSFLPQIQGSREIRDHGFSVTINRIGVDSREPSLCAIKISSFIAMVAFIVSLRI